MEVDFITKFALYLLLGVFFWTGIAFSNGRCEEIKSTGLVSQTEVKKAGLAKQSTTWFALRLQNHSAWHPFQNGSWHHSVLP